MTFSNNMVPCLSYGELYEEYKCWTISVRENGKCQNFGYFIGFLFGHTPMHGEYIYILVWPRMASVQGRITVKFTVVCIYTYVHICIRTYPVLLSIYTYVLYLYVLLLIYYLYACTYNCTYILVLYYYMYVHVLMVYVHDTYISTYIPIL